MRLVCDNCHRTEDEARAEGFCADCAWESPQYATRPIPRRHLNVPGLVVFCMIVIVALVGIVMD